MCSLPHSTHGTEGQDAHQDGRLPALFFPITVSTALSLPFSNALFVKTKRRGTNTSIGKQFKPTYIMRAK